MTKQTLIRTLLSVLLAAGAASSALAQDAFYTFTSGPGGDGFAWPASPTGMLDFQSTFPPDDLGGSNRIDNFTGNNVFFDDQYQAAGNSSVISNEAMWGNPIDNGFPTIDFDFGDDFGTMADTIEFDLAWATSGADAPTFINIDFYDNTENFASETYDLNDVFNAGGTFGGFDGAEGHISIDVADLVGFGGPLNGISGMYIDFSPIATLGGTSEFAVDNFDINGAGGGPGGLDPANSEVIFNGFNIQTNRLQGTFDATLSNIEVENIGTGGTTYSVTLEPTSDPEFLLESPATNAVINGGELLPNGTGTVARLPAGTISGTYVADFTLRNDLNALDPDDPNTYTVRVLDPPSTTDDSGATVQADIDPNIFISNAAAGPHPGALRTGVDVTARTVTGDGFSVNGLNVGDVADAGETENATVNFDRFGRVNGTYNGTFSVDLQMDDPNFSFLNGKQPVPSINWNLEFALGTINNDSIAVNASDPLGPSLVGVNDADTAATLIDGASNTGQTVSMDLSTDPGSNADLAGTPVDLTFSAGGTQDPFVLQFTYLDGNIPGGITETDLQILKFDTGSGDWILAVDDNAAGTPTFFNGSYTDFLSTLGGGSLDPSDLGFFGVDTVNNHAWAILDNASTFGIGVLTTGLAGDLDGDGFVGITDLNIVLGAWNQNVPPANPQADPSGDNFVGIADLNIVLGNWNAGTPPGDGANIPEPSSAGVLALLGAALLRSRRV